MNEEKGSRLTKYSFRHVKCHIKDFHTMYALFPADKAANNVVHVVVWPLYYVDTVL